MYMVLLVSGFQDNAGKFFLFMLGIFAQNMAASGLVFSIGAIVGVYAAAQTIVSVVLVFAMVSLLYHNANIL